MTNDPTTAPDLKRTLLLFLLAVWMVALVYSPFLLSVSMFGVLLLAPIQLQRARPWVQWDRVALHRLRDWRQQWPLIGWGLFFVLVLLSGWMTADWPYWWERMRIKTPFFFFPLAVLMLPPFREKEYSWLFRFLLVLLTVTSIGIVVHYALHFDAIQIGMKEGRPIPTPRNHIRYAMMLVMGIWCGIWAWQRERPGSRWWWLTGGMTVFLFLFIHFLSVRSGLLALYVVLVVGLAQWMYHQRRWKLGLLLLIGLALLPVAAYITLPSVKAKVDYMKFDYYKFQRGEGGDYADAGRLTSLMIGTELFGAHPLIGVGAGNLRQEVQAIYQARFPDYVEPHMPHNQYLFIAAGTGLAGLSLFLLGLLLPLFAPGTLRSPLRTGFYAVLLTIMLIEHTLENSLGIGFALLFFGLAWNNCPTTSDNTY